MGHLTVKHQLGRYRHSPLLIWAILAVALGWTHQSFGEEWKLGKEIEGVKIYFRDRDTSNIKELKLSFTVEATLSQCVAFLTDVKAYPEWIHSCVKSRVVGRASPNDTTYYTFVDFPRPLADRDMVSRGSYRQDPKSLIVYMGGEAQKGIVPETKGVVRVVDSKTRWILTPKGEKKVEIDYVIVSDPGGGIPSWLINPFLHVGPSKSVKNLRRLISKNIYRTAKVDGIQNMEGPSD